MQQLPAFIASAALSALLTHINSVVCTLLVSRDGNLEKRHLASTAAQH